MSAERPTGTPDVDTLLVILGAAVGAPLRYLTDRAVQARHDSVFPWGTFTVNAIGSVVLGLTVGAVTAAAVPHSLQLLVGVGFCGTLTTYSTFSYETLRLYEGGARLYAVANVVVSVAAGVGAAFTGAAIAQAVWPGSLQ
jgi:fluoride exporter